MLMLFVLPNEFVNTTKWVYSGTRGAASLVCLCSLGTLASNKFSTQGLCTHYPPLNRGTCSTSFERGCKLGVSNDKIKLEWLNYSVESFKIAMKKVFL